MPRKSKLKLTTQKRRITLTVPGELMELLLEAQQSTMTGPPLTQLILHAIEKEYA